MSFLAGLKNVIMGKPVYGADGKISDSSQPVTLNTNQGPVKVYIEDVDSSLNGDRMETFCQVKNDSDTTVFLDKISLLGSTTGIDAMLKPGDSKQVKAFSGQAPKNTGSNDAELQYRTEAGVYYKARHDVRFKPEDDYYVIVRMPYENTSQL